MTSDQSFAEAAKFFDELHGWLAGGLLPLPEDANAAQGFSLLWREHGEFQEDVDFFLRACLRPDREETFVLRTRAQRQLYVRVASALEILRESNGHAKLVRLSLPRDASTQDVIELLGLRLWQKESFARAWVAKRAHTFPRDPAGN